MKFTALIREIVTRDIRVIVNADSKGQAKRILTGIAAHDKYRDGFVASRVVDVTPRIDTIEPLTPESFNDLRSQS